VVDSSNLERNLYLVSQVIELGLPVIVALNMTDLVERSGQEIDAKKLSQKLGCPVIPCQANNKTGLTELKLAMSRAISAPPSQCFNPPYYIVKEIEKIQAALVDEEPENACLIPLKLQLMLTEADIAKFARALCWETLVPAILNARTNLDNNHPDWREELVAARYAQISDICAAVLRRRPAPIPDITDRLDAVLLHPCWGWMFFFGVMSLMFFSIFTIANYPMDWLTDVFSRFSGAIKDFMPPGDLRDLLTDGIIAGVGGVVVFLPQILILFFFIGLLEDSGYMSRAAFLMDRVMSRVGLHGKSFIPLLSSYACAIPGIMATRTVENPKDRLVTILIAPLMSCSARLPVYGLMIATLFAGQSVAAWIQAGMMMAMYIFGTAAAFACAWLFKRTLLKAERQPLILELPPYRKPVLATVLANMMMRAKAFLVRAGTVILGLSIILWFLMSFPRQSGATPQEVLRNSFAGQFGRLIEPAIEPLGFNWKIGIGLLGAQAAREVFVSTISIVYSVDNSADVTEPLRDALLADRWPDGRAVFTPLVCLSVMVFFVLSMQCFSTLVIMRRETGTWKWPLFAFMYMTGLAYLVALLVYQGGTWMGY
jgi:ferrous iron transport protein B